MVSCDVQLMEFLRSKHPTMAQVLEVVLGDIGEFSARMAMLRVLAQCSAAVSKRLVSCCASSSPKGAPCLYQSDLSYSCVTSRMFSWSTICFCWNQDPTSSLTNCTCTAGSRFVPKPEERLLAVVHALLLRCYKLPFSNAADVPQSLKRELHGVCKACFSNDTVNRHSRNSKASVVTIADYKDRFIHDLNPEAPGFPSTLGDLATKLKVIPPPCDGHVT